MRFNQLINIDGFTGAVSGAGFPVALPWLPLLNYHDESSALAMVTMWRHCCWCVCWSHVESTLLSRQRRRMKRLLLLLLISLLYVSLQHHVVWVGNSQARKTFENEKSFCRLQMFTGSIPDDDTCCWRRKQDMTLPKWFSRKLMQIIWIFHFNLS